ncbi:MAG: mlaE 1 [Gammaproteobacteria bacterium]|jgi:phospholipid/cholesterol/gamma-HCH transport system permease protein|nr:mlaE 1 [Gammaproteobacteria bacterium]
MNAHALVVLDTQAPRLICRGEWSLTNLSKIKADFQKIVWPYPQVLTVDGQAVTRMDSAGAWLLAHSLKEIASKGLETSLQHFSEQAQILLALVEKRAIEPAYIPIPVLKRRNGIEQLGYTVVQQLVELKNFLHFTGELAFEFVGGIFHPQRWRWNELAAVIGKTGVQALPIIALLSFMIGVVIAYQMGNQLRNYGANVFIVNLLGLSVLREFGPLITAIMVAGRTGSAFTAQLGIMKLNQEIDALNTMGVTPGQLLLLPRLLGLLIALPLLTMWADIFGILGGIVMTKNMLDLTAYDFLHRFHHEIPLRALFIGLGKAPVFALLIGSIGCFQGMRVQGGADSVGKQTTRSVVLAIFFIIVVDAIFSIIFSRLKL